MAKKKKAGGGIAQLIDQVLQEAKSSSSKQHTVVDIITFCEAPQFLNFKGQDPAISLWDMQRIVLKLFYRGTRGNEHLELSEHELDILTDIAINEDLDYDEGKGGFRQVIDKYFRRVPHNQLLLVMGRRSSKTMLVSIIAAYEAYKLLECPEGNPHKFYKLTGDKPIAILNVAVSEKQAYDPLFKEIQSRIARSPYFSDKINHTATTSDTIYLLTDADKRENTARGQRGMSIMLDGSVVLKSGHSNSASLRGQAAICILFDEFAHFQTSSGKSSGDEVYSALTPSTRQFGIDGKVVLLSDPRGRDGMFWKLFNMAQDREILDGKINYLNEDILALQLPTWRMNPNKEFSKKELEVTEKPKDPVKYYSTWNARFQAEAGEKFFNEQKVMDCIQPLMTETKFGDPRYSYYIHFDASKSSHNFALAVVHVITLQNQWGQIKRRVVLDIMKVWTPSKSGPPLLSTVEEYIRDVCKRFRVVKVTADSFQSAQMLERLAMSGIRTEETPFIPTYTTKIYVELRNLVNEADIVIYPHEHLIGEMKSLRAKVTSRGYKIEPDKQSEYPTDDCCDALAGASYQALTNIISKGFPRSGTVYTGPR
jgi:hypothetical protein